MMNFISLRLIMYKVWLGAVSVKVQQLLKTTK